MALLLGWLIDCITIMISLKNQVDEEVTVAHTQSMESAMMVSLSMVPVSLGVHGVAYGEQLH